MPDSPVDENTNLMWKRFGGDPLKDFDPHAYWLKERAQRAAAAGKTRASGVIKRLLERRSLDPELQAKLISVANQISWRQDGANAAYVRALDFNLILNFIERGISITELSLLMDVPARVLYGEIKRRNLLEDFQIAEDMQGDAYMDEALAVLVEADEDEMNRARAIAAHLEKRAERRSRRWRPVTKHEGSPGGGGGGSVTINVVPALSGHGVVARTIEGEKVEEPPVTDVYPSNNVIP